MSRRRSIFVASTIDPAEQKSLEESLSAEIYANLRCLNYVHPIAAGSEQYLIKDIFIKPNKNAFHYLVHYILMIIDPNEFRKKFYWPVTTREAEFEFRNAALAYFNGCSEKFGWHIGPFKMQVVLFPGGIEFMKIIIQLTVLAMHAVIKRNESSDNGGSLTLKQAKWKTQQIEEFAQYAADIKRIVENQIAMVDRRTAALEKLLLNVLLASGVPIKPTDILESELLRYWQNYLRKTIGEKLRPVAAEIHSISKKCQNLQRMIECTPDKGCFTGWEVIPQLNATSIHIGSPLWLNHEKLFEYFFENYLHMMNACIMKEPRLKPLPEQYIVMQGILERANNFDELSKGFEKSDSAISSMSDNGSQRSCGTQHLMMLMIPTTPPISLDRTKRKPLYRLPLIDSFPPA